MATFNTRRWFAAIGPAAVCSLLAIAVGCQRGPERVVVSGDVTYRGQPVPQGSIGFYPAEGTSGSPAIVAITDGKYKAESLGGVPVGEYRVVILAMRKAAQRPMPANHDDLPPLNAVEQYLPAKYNARTELKTAVDAGSGQLTRDFTLGD